MDERIRLWKQKFEQMSSDRAVFNSQWDEVAKVVSPDAAKFTSDYNTPGEKKNQELYDATGVHANELLAAGFYSLLTSPSQKWFELHTNDALLDQEREVELWLSEVSNRMYAEMSRPHTGFITAVHEAYHSLGAFGNCILFVTETKNLKSLQFVSLPLQECYFAESRGVKVDTLYRKYKRTAGQLVKTFGIENVSEKVKKLFEENNTVEKLDILHVIEPIKGKKGKPWSSIYIELQNDHILSESGFDECPFMAARFYKTSYEVYGRGPGSSALPDLKMLQQIAKTTIRGAQKVVDPPLLVPDQGFIGNIRVTPGGISYFRSGLSADDRVVPLQTGGNPGLGEDLAQSIRNRVREMFYVDQLQLNDGPQMTATEVLQRTEERMRLLGPVTGRAQAELLGPCLERVFGLMRRAGRLPEPPEILLDPSVKLRIVYQSPMMKAQEQTEANGLLRVAQLMSPFMSMDPTVMDVFNPEAIARGVGKMYSLNPHFYRSEDEVAALREQRAQQQQQAQMMEMMQSGGTGLKNMAQGMAALGEMQ